MTHALIIDDNPMNTDVLKMMLRREGVEQTAIHSPRYLWDALDQIGVVDIIFLDLEMPHQNGFDLLGELKVDDRLSGVPVVAYTVHTSEIDEVRLAGFDGFLGKPLDVKRFPDQLQRILNHQPVWEI